MLKCINASGNDQLDSSATSFPVNQRKRRAGLKRLASNLAFATSLVAVSLNVAADETVPVENFTEYNDLGSYLSENLNPQLKADIAKRKLAVFAVTYSFEGQKACYAAVGLTEKSHKDRNARFPVYTFTSFRKQTAKDWNPEKCVSETLSAAFASLNKAPAGEYLEAIDRTFSSGGARPSEPAKSTTANLQVLGTVDNKRALFDAIHSYEFGQAFDYRHVQTSVHVDGSKFDNGDIMCVASAGLSGRPPQNRNARFPAKNITLGRVQLGGTVEGCKAVLAEQAVNQLLNQPWTAAGLLKDFSYAREDGIPPPDEKKARSIQLSREQSRQKVIEESKRVERTNAPPLVLLKQKVCKTETRYESRPFNENVCDYNQFGPINCRNITTRYEQIPYQEQVCN